MMFPTLPALDILSTFNDLAFVIKILVFCYVIYWLFIVFREQQILLGIGTIVAAYFMFFHAVSLTILVLLFFVFIVMSGHFQFLIDMGFMPILEMLGFKPGGHGQAQEEQLKMQELEQKMLEGKTLSQEEIKLFRDSQEKQRRYQERAQELLGQYGQGGR